MCAHVPRSTTVTTSSCKARGSFKIVRPPSTGQDREARSFPTMSGPYEILSPPPKDRGWDVAELTYGLRVLHSEIQRCHRCPGLNEPGVTGSAPGRGPVNAPIVLVGQSLCRRCMETQVPFTGGCGRLLDEVSRSSNLSRAEVFVTNAVHCHPPGNRPSLPQERLNCRSYLRRELILVHPTLVVGLGKDAQLSIEEIVGASSARSETEEAGLARNSWQLFSLYVKHPSHMLRRPERERKTYISLLSGALRWAAYQHSLPSRIED